MNELNWFKYGIDSVVKSEEEEKKNVPIDIL